MKAIVCTAYGPPDVLHLTNMDKPVQKHDEVLIRIKASSVTAADSMMRKGEPFYGRFILGLRKPKYPVSGTGLAGIVESVGKDVQRFKVGDKVFGESVFGTGANADFTCMAAEGVIELMPDNITYMEAAPICDGALTSYNFLVKLGKIKATDKVLIIGASGSLGTSAVQLARHFGAEVTGVCSTTNLDMVRSLGASRLIDYTKTNFTKTDFRYDIIFDTVGSRSYSQCKNSLTEHGYYLSAGLSMPLLFQTLWTKLFNGKRAIFSATGLLPANELRTMLADIRELLLTGQLTTVIDKTFELENAAAAHRYVDTRRKKGNVVLV